MLLTLSATEAGVPPVVVGHRLERLIAILEVDGHIVGHRDHHTRAKAEAGVNVRRSRDVRGTRGLGDGDTTSQVGDKTATGIESEPGFSQCRSS